MAGPGFGFGMLMVARPELQLATAQKLLMKAEQKLSQFMDLFMTMEMRLEMGFHGTKAMIEDWIKPTRDFISVNRHALAAALADEENGNEVLLRLNELTDSVSDMQAMLARETDPEVLNIERYHRVTTKIDGQMQALRTALDAYRSTSSSTTTHLGAPERVRDLYQREAERLAIDPVGTPASATPAAPNSIAAEAKSNPKSAVAKVVGDQLLEMKQNLEKFFGRDGMQKERIRSSDPKSAELRNLMSTEQVDHFSAQRGRGSAPTVNSSDSIRAILHDVKSALKKGASVETLVNLSVRLQKIQEAYSKLKGTKPGRWGTVLEYMKAACDDAVRFASKLETLQENGRGGLAEAIRSGDLFEYEKHLNAELAKRVAAAPDDPSFIANDELERLANERPEDGRHQLSDILDWIYKQTEKATRATERYQKACAEAIAEGRPLPPRPQMLHMELWVALRKNPSTVKRLVRVIALQIGEITVKNPHL